MWLYCHQCLERSRVESSESAAICPHCSSDFVEFDATTPRRSEAEQQQSPLQRAASAPQPQHNAPGVSGDGAEDPGMAFAQMMLQHMMGPRAHQAAVIADGNRHTVFHINAGGGMPMHFGPPLGGGLSLGDFAMGNNFEQIMAQLAAQHEPLPQPTSRDVLKSMSHIKVTSAASAAAPSTAGPGEHPASDGAAPAAKAGEACTVCHDEFVDGMEVAQLPGCGHCFHDDCITPWLEQHNTCPVCRHSLPVDEELQRQAQQQRRAQLRQPFQQNNSGDAQQAHGAAPGAQTIADFANTLIAQLTLAQGQQGGGAGIIAIPVFHMAGASPHERRPTNDGRPARIVRARVGRPDEVRSRTNAQSAAGNSRNQPEAGHPAQPSNQDLRSDADAGAEANRGSPLCRLQ